MVETDFQILKIGIKYTYSTRNPFCRKHEGPCCACELADLNFHFSDASEEIVRCKESSKLSEVTMESEVLPNVCQSKALMLYQVQTLFSIVLLFADTSSLI